MDVYLQLVLPDSYTSQKFKCNLNKKVMTEIYSGALTAWLLRKGSADH
jgi:hypothetical protein